jgi:hypothetical protein
MFVIPMLTPFIIGEGTDALGRNALYSPYGAPCSSYRVLRPRESFPNEVSLLITLLSSLLKCCFQASLRLYSDRPFHLKPKPQVSRTLPPASLNYMNFNSRNIINFKDYTDFNHHATVRTISIRHQASKHIKLMSAARLQHNFNSHNIRTLNIINANVKKSFSLKICGSIHRLESGRKVRIRKQPKFWCK